MSDVFCTSCGEPYDSYHMKEDMWFDMEDYHTLAKIACEHYRETGAILPSARSALLDAGWEFGNSVFFIKRCPACKQHELERDGVDPLRESMVGDVDTIDELLHSDPDAVQAAIEDVFNVG